MCRCLNRRNRAPHPGSLAPPQTLQRGEPTEALSSQGGPSGHKRLRVWRAGAGGKADLGSPKPEQASLFWSPKVQEALPSQKPRLQIHRLLECIPLSLQLPPLTLQIFPWDNTALTGTLRPTLCAALALRWRLKAGCGACTLS